VKDQTSFIADTPADREAFYQMLAAAGRAKPGQLFREAEQELSKTPRHWRWTDPEGQQQYSVVPLFNDPASQRGRLVELLGTARRVEKILVSDPDIVARFGIDHYYQVSLFTDDCQGNPLTFCLRELPKGMPYGNLPRYGEAVRAAGFFFKTWSYTVLKASDAAPMPGDSKTRRQLSPLLIGDTLQWYPVAKPSHNTFAGALIGGVCLIGTAIIWLAIWQSRRRELQRRVTTESPRFTSVER
jgi:hypothetical protein